MRGRPFTESEDRMIVAQRRTGTAFRLIAEILDRHPDSVKDRYYYVTASGEPKRRVSRDIGPPIHQPQERQEDGHYVDACNAEGGFTRENFWNLRQASGDTRGMVQAIRALEAR